MADTSANEGADSSKKGRMKKKAFIPSTSSFKGGTEKIKFHTFVYSEIKTNGKKWITSKEKFIVYAGSKYSIDEELSLRNKQLTVVTSDVPDKPKAGADKYDEHNYSMKMKAHHTREASVKVNLTTLFRVLWDQCDHGMQNKIKAHESYKSVRN